MSTPYPTAHQIEEIFANRVDQKIFNSHLADPVSITIVDQNLPLGGHYKSVQHFDEAAYGRMAQTMKMETVQVEVIRVMGGGESPWAAVETLVTGTSIHDKPYHSEFLTVVRFDSQGKIAQMKEFLDSGLVHNHLEEHESETKDEK